LASQSISVTIQSGLKWKSQRGRKRTSLRAWEWGSLPWRGEVRGAKSSITTQARLSETQLLAEVKRKPIKFWFIMCSSWLIREAGAEMQPNSSLSMVRESHIESR
jgi:hypothetical protein